MSADDKTIPNGIRTIVTPLEGGAELIIYDDPTTLITEDTVAIYGRQKLEETIIREGESLAEYLERLKLMYPEPEQVAYLEAFFTTKLYGAQSMEAFMHYVSGMTRPVKGDVLEPFPAKINNEIMGMGYPDDRNRWVIRMDNSRANDLVRLLNVTSILVERAGNNMLTQARNSIRSILKGQDRDIPLAMRMKILGLVGSVRILDIGVEYDEIVEITVSQIVNEDTLGLLTGSAAHHMRNISKMLGSPFSPAEFYAESVGVGLALDNLQMPGNIISRCVDIAIDLQISP